MRTKDEAPLPGARTGKIEEAVRENVGPVVLPLRRVAHLHEGLKQAKDQILGESRASRHFRGRESFAMAGEHVQQHECLCPGWRRHLVHGGSGVGQCFEEAHYLIDDCNRK